MTISIEPILLYGDRIVLDYSMHEVLYNHFEFQKFKDISESKKYLENLIEKSQESYQQFWFIKELNSQKYIGSFGVHGLNEARDSVEIGYALSPIYWGKGYFQESANIIINYIFNDLYLHRITAITAKDNIASIIGLERLGFEIEGVMSHYYKKHDGNWFDGLLLAKLKDTHSINQNIKKLKDSHSSNQNINLLCELNLSDKNSFEIINYSTRDVADLNVLKCRNSGVIVVEKYILNDDYYENKINTVDYADARSKKDESSNKFEILEDDFRRFESHKDLIKGSEILDFGCGSGGFIKLSQKISKRSVGLEPNIIYREYLQDIGVQCVNELAVLNNDKFDLITLYHVFEHLNDPINILIELKKYLKDDGTIIIEVPNARDLLLESFNLKDFKNFTFWSEHLILHTRKSIEIFAEESGLKMKNIQGVQRYPISNHFNWLLNGEPSGQEIFKNLNNKNFHKHYEKFLNSIDQTDTLIAYFNKKN